MKSQKLNIVFSHKNLGQFRNIHTFLNENGMANSWLICDHDAYLANKDKIPNLIPLKDIDSSYDRSIITKRVEHLALAIKETLIEHMMTHPVDAYIGHIIFGPPNLLFELAKIKIIVYAEYPSFRSHGIDPLYPPSPMEKRIDKSLERLTRYTVSQSDLAIVPSKHAKSLFPNGLQSKIKVIHDGFYLRNGCIETSSFLKESSIIGFFARDLSSSKGFEKFLKISKKISQLRSDIKFSIIGGGATPYGYEKTFLKQEYPDGEIKTFVGHLINQYEIDLSRYEFKGLLAGPKLSEEVSKVDVFLYPLMHGSFNWGLWEILSLGAAVIASDRCYIPEVIEDGLNGYIVDIDRENEWIEKALYLIDHKDKLMDIKSEAVKLASKFSISKMANRYLQIVRSITK